MRRILLLLAGAAVLALPVAAAARAPSHHASVGFLVVRGALADGGVSGRPVATVAVRGFVLGHIAEEGRVQIYHLSSGGLAAQVTGVAISRRHVKCCHGAASGTEFSGSGFRFRAVGGVWRVVVYGAGVSLYAGGEFRRVSLHGSVAYPDTDGVYSFDGGPFASLPSGVVKRTLGEK